MTQGINREKIFSNSKNIEKYIKIIEEKQRNCEIVIIAYCIMTNHAHFLIKADKIEELSKFMQKVNTKYAIYYNKVNNRIGYVYRDRYKLQKITDIEHLYRCIEYIHDNPLKAGICIKQEQYKYSSFNLMYNSNRTELYTKVGELLNENDLCRDTNEPIKFLEEKIDKDMECKKLIDEFLSEHSISKMQLLEKNNRKILKSMVEKFRNIYSISYRSIERNLGISRETLRKLNK